MYPTDWLTTARGFASFLLTAGKSKETVRTYSSAVSLFWRWCDEREMDPILAPRNLVRAYLTEQSERVSSTRVHSYLAALRIFYAFVVDAEWRADDPTKALRIKRTETLPTQPLDADELNALLRACSNERDRLILLLLCYSGVRISEFAGMAAEDIDWKNGTITIRGKGDVMGQVAPHEVILGRLRSYLGLFPSGPLWLSQRDHNPLKAHQIRKIIYRIAENAEMKGVHPHRFRATFACEFIEQYGDIQALKGAMRHKSIDTTARYAQAVERRRGLQKMRGLTLAV